MYFNNPDMNFKPQHILLTHGLFITLITAVVATFMVGRSESTMNHAFVIVLALSAAYWLSIRYITQRVEGAAKSHNPYHRFFFTSTRVISVLLAILGAVAAALIYMDNGNLFHAIGLLVVVIWLVIFLRYFMWAVYHYNINYGYTDKDWERVFEARAQGKTVEAPTKNPYRSQTFGLPPGTVRGMIAFTLLFGGMALLVASFGSDYTENQLSLVRNQFEFFETAFLMMIAFYFGDKSLKYLQKHRNKDDSSTKEKDSTDKKGRGANPAEGGAGQQVVLADEVDEEEAGFDTALADFDQEQGDASPTSAIAALHEAEGAPAPGKGLVPILDAGHGGIIDGQYVTSGKQYHFTDGTVIYEGEVNRQIGKLLAAMLREAGIPYHEQTLSSNEDISRPDRIAYANGLFAEHKNVYFLSIHSNAASGSSSGEGSKAHGFEIFTSRGETRSDDLAEIAYHWYKKSFPDRRFRKDMTDGDHDKEKDYDVLKKTACPAFLVENLFYDNLEEARYLLSDEGQQAIASCLFEIVKEIYQTQSV